MGVSDFLVGEECKKVLRFAFLAWMSRSYDFPPGGRFFNIPSAHTGNFNLPSWMPHYLSQ